jgi:small subunit ribosomal protein S1
VSNSQYNSNQTMEELLATLKNKNITLTRGQEVEGEVVSIDDKEVLVDLGLKSEGMISTKDLSEETLKNLKVGNKIKAYVIDGESETGLIALSPSQSGAPKAGVGRWDKFIEAKSTGNQLSGQVIEASGEGLVVEVDGVRGFIPSSQISDPSKKEELIGKKVSVGVLEVDLSSNKLIFSQKTGGQDFEAIAKKYPKNSAVKGKVTKVTQFGVFVSLESGIEGLIHISKLGPDDNLTVGSDVTVTIDSVDTNKKRISLVPTITSTKGLIYK